MSKFAYSEIIGGKMIYLYWGIGIWFGIGAFLYFWGNSGTPLSVLIDWSMFGKIAKGPLYFFALLGDKG